MISTDGIGLIGLDDEGQLYLNGKRLYTEKRFATQERAIGWIGLSVGAIAAGATLASAVADWMCR